LGWVELKGNEMRGRTGWVERRSDELRNNTLHRLRVSHWMVSGPERGSGTRDSKRKMVGNRRTDERTNRRTDERTNRRTDEQTNRRTDEQTNRQERPLGLNQAQGRPSEHDKGGGTGHGAFESCRRAGIDLNSRLRKLSLG